LRKDETSCSVSLTSHPQDLNLIENLWEELERRVKKRQPKNLRELELHLIQEWNNMELSVLEKLVDSVPSRLYQCVKMKDYSTKY
jgi:hypothetical protein